MKTPVDLGVPAYLMSFPFYVSIKEPNNPWMSGDTEYNYEKAYQQFTALYQRLSKDGVVFLLPATEGLQDQPFVANLGIVLPNYNFTCIVANFKSKPRVAEAKIGKEYLHLLGYNVYQPPTTWEGEADLKYLHSNKFIGGYGIRSTKEAYTWMMENFDVDITMVKMTDEKLYHLDCSVFPLDSKNTIVATDLFSKADISSMEKVTNIISLPKEFYYYGWTNTLRVKNKILHAPPASGVLDIKNSDLKYCKFIEKLGYEAEIFDLSEFEKSGADLSCLVMHLNWKD